MTGNTGPDRSAADDWDTYWRGTQANAAHHEGGPQDAVLSVLWQEIVAQVDGDEGQDEHARILDLACGNGAVTGYVQESLPLAALYAIDYSRSAVAALGQRYPAVACVAGDALGLPFADGTFDLVGSQFGLEYAGRAAASEAARLVAPGGTLALVMHLHDGGIYRECEQNLEAIDTIATIELLARTRAAFSAGYDLNEGVGSVEAFKAAEREFAPAVRALEALLAERGDKVASGLARKLYQDIAYMYKRISNYDRADVINWVDGMTGELAAYRGRMSSMMACAQDESGVSEVEAMLVAAGLSLIERRPVTMGEKAEAAAWLVLARRS